LLFILFYLSHFISFRIFRITLPGYAAAGDLPDVIRFLLVCVKGILGDFRGGGRAFLGRRGGFFIEENAVFC